MSDGEQIMLIGFVLLLALLFILSVPLMVAWAAQTMAKWATDDTVKALPGGFPVQLAARDGSPLRYAILHHTGIDEPHFDLLFELEKGALLSCWRSACWPITRATTLLRLADHRREYLDYEGPVIGNRGEVKRVAGGEFWIEAAGEGVLRIAAVDGWKISMRRLEKSENWSAEGESAARVV